MGYLHRVDCVDSGAIICSWVGWLLGGLKIKVYKQRRPVIIFYLTSNSNFIEKYDAFFHFQPFNFHLFCFKVDAMDPVKFI